MKKFYLICFYALQDQNQRMKCTFWEEKCKLVAAAATVATSVVEAENCRSQAEFDLAKYALVHKLF